MQKKRRLNWKPDHGHIADKLYGAHPWKPVSLPSKVDLRPNCSPVFDQGQIGSCTGNATSAHLEFLQLMELRENLPLAQSPEEFAGKNYEPISRLFIYYNERLIAGTVSEDSGATLRNAVDAVRIYGCCRESLWGYGDDLTFQKPSDAAYGEARLHQVPHSFRLMNLHDMKSCLAHGFPFIFGIMIYESFQGGNVADTGMVPVPSPSESLEGGHCVMGVGYDDDRQLLLVRNSWGDDWGDKGYFYLPYEYVTNGDLASSFWTLRRDSVF